MIAASRSKAIPGKALSVFATGALLATISTLTYCVVSQYGWEGTWRFIRTGYHRNVHVQTLDSVEASLMDLTREREPVLAHDAPPWKGIHRSRLAGEPLATINAQFWQLRDHLVRIQRTYWYEYGINDRTEALLARLKMLQQRISALHTLQLKDIDN